MNNSERESMTTIPATHPVDIRTYGDGARMCPLCGRVYPENDVPTNCAEDCLSNDAGIA